MTYSQEVTREMIDAAMKAYGEFVDYDGLVPKMFSRDAIEAALRAAFEAREAKQ
jgi:hypothetical protein